MSDPDVEPWKMERPHGVDVDSDGRIYVSDTGLINQRVLVFSPGGTYLGQITGFVQPLGMEIDGEDKLYVASFNSNEVKVFRIDPPDITITPPSFNYGNVDVVTTASTTFTVQNDGTGDLVIGTVTDPAVPFSTTADTCTGQTLIPAATCTISINFAPTGSTTYASNFNIPSNDPDEDLVSVSLQGTGNYPPTADAGGPYAETEGQSVILDGSGSSDTGGSIVQYEWDVDDDGTYEYSTSSPTQSHTYDQDGIYTVRLRVTDNLGATDEATATATIADTSPTAAFTGSPTSGSAPLTVNFTDNSTGYDQPLSYAWDFDFITNPGIDSTDQNPTYIYNSEGTYTVKLTVTDSDGSSNEIIETNYITVSPGACANLPVWIEGTPAYYSSLQTAYYEAFDNDSIFSHAGALAENIILNRDITITIVGGYDCDYIDNSSGETTISGSITINNGMNTIDSVTVQ
jgi:PKD repeat protein